MKIFEIIKNSPDLVFVLFLIFISIASLVYFINAYFQNKSKIITRILNAIIELKNDNPVQNIKETTFLDMKNNGKNPCELNNPINIDASYLSKSKTMYF